MKSQKGQILYRVDRFAALVLRIVVVLFVVLLVLACFGIENRYAWYISGGLFALSVLCRIILSPFVKSEEEEEFEQQVEYILSKKSCEESKPSVTNTDYTPLRNLNHSQEGLVKQHLFRMVVDGLHGEFAVLSGNALMLQVPNKRAILALPPEIDFKGTMIMVRIPAQVPDGFNLYNYMS